MKWIIFALVLVLLSYSVMGFPQLPTGYWGEVSDDNGLLAGIDVSVTDEHGVELDSTSTESDGKYYLTVPWDDGETPEREGVVAGQELRFYVDNELVKTVDVSPKGEDVRYDFDTTADNGASGNNNVPPVTDPIVNTSEPIENVTEPIDDQTVTNLTEPSPELTPPPTEPVLNMTSGNESEETDGEEEKSKGIRWYWIIGIIVLAIIIIVIYKRK